MAVNGQQKAQEVNGMAGFLNSTSKKSGLKTSGKKTGTGKGTGGGGGGGTIGSGSKSGSIWGAAKTVTDMVSDNLKNMLGGNKSTVSSAGKTAAPASSATLTGAAKDVYKRQGDAGGGAEGETLERAGGAEEIPAAVLGLLGVSTQYYWWYNILSSFSIIISSSSFISISNSPILLISSLSKVLENFRYNIIINLALDKLLRAIHSKLA